MAVDPGNGGKSRPCRHLIPGGQGRGRNEVQEHDQGSGNRSSTIGAKPGQEAPEVGDKRDLP